MNPIPFTKEERTIIAEFVYSNEQDILIITDAIKLIDVLYNHKLIDTAGNWLKRVEEKEPKIIADLDLILKTKISDEQGTSIMDEYYGRKTPSIQDHLKEKEVPQKQVYNWGLGNASEEK